MKTNKDSQIVSASIPFFVVDLPHLRSEFEPLNKVGSYEKLENGVYRWTFPFPELRLVQTILGGKLVQFDKMFLLENVIAHCDPLLEELEVTLHRKGKGTITYTLEEEGYRVTWYQQGKKKTFLVSKDLVEKVWMDVVSKLDKEKKVKSDEVWKRIVVALEKFHWHYPLFIDEKENEEMKKAVRRGKWKYQPSENFNKHHFFGDRRNYFKLFYCPIKCLVAMGLIQHTRGGHVIRIADRDEFKKQAKITEKIILDRASEPKAPPEIGTAEHPTTWKIYGRRTDGQSRIIG